VTNVNTRDASNRRRLSSGGPSINAPPLWAYGGNPGGPLTEEDRSMLALIATIVRFKKGETIYLEMADATGVFSIIAGTVRSYRDLPDGHRHIVGFLFPNDVFGLAENGQYVNSAEAVTAVTAYKIPAAALQARLRRNPNLDFQVICRLCHDLREAQHHAYLLSRHRAVAKLGLFIQMLETHQAAEGGVTGIVHLPMTRTDIGAYINISPETVSRSFRELVSRGAVSVRDRRHVQIIDHAKLEAAILS